MKIDRREFFLAAMSMAALPAVAGCGPVPPPASGPTPMGNTAPETGPVEEGGAVRSAPADECTEWDPSGECIGWAGDSTMPANECTSWDPSGECIGWAGDATMPANECTNWDPSGECIGWAPANECTGWDPSGECTSWN